MKKHGLKAILAVLMICLLAAPSVWAKTIKIGAILAVTGPASFLGGPEARTLQMMVDDINAKFNYIRK